MATQLKPFEPNDLKTSKTLLHEAIPVTGSVVSGTYANAAHASLQENIRDYSHGMFQSVYDYPYLSSSANHLFDITFGYSANSPFSSSDSLVHPGTLGNPSPVQQAKKINIYNQMAQILMGHDETGSIKEFQFPTGRRMREAYFINFSRLLIKDEIKKGSFSLKLGMGNSTASFLRFSNNGVSADASTGLGKYYDLETIVRQPPAAGQTDLFYTDSPAGEYAVLSGSTNREVGLLFYQAGIAVITASVLIHPSGGLANTQSPSENGLNLLSGALGFGNADGTNSTSIRAIMTGSTIKNIANQLRHRLYNVEFNNTVELHSTKYFCRAHHDEFNYSSNPTYLTGSLIRVKTSTFDQPVSYITTVGLYSAAGELLAVSKLSEPLKKSPENDLSITVRLDF
jgi:hypothetical protein